MGAAGRADPRPGSPGTPARLVPRQGLRRRQGAERPHLRAAGAADLPAVRHRPRRRAALEGLRLLAAGVQLRLQGHLPVNPDHFKGVTPALAFNTAVSFLTNTNWQNYAGESTMAQLSQMAGLAFHNYETATAGAAVAVALVRGLIRKRTQNLGNFWVDLTRTCTRVLLPICIVATIILVSQGAVQNFHGDTTVHTVQGATQQLPGGPIASQEAIKEAGQNGG